MSADFNTVITIRGKQEDIEKALEIVEKYIDKKSDVRFDEFRYDPKKTRGRIKDGALKLDLNGPYGRFGSLDELSIPEEIAEASPDVSFQYDTSGFSTGADEGTHAVYENRKLTRKNFYMPNECKSEDYSKMIRTQKFSYEKIRSIVNISKGAYEDFLDALDEFCWEIDDMTIDDVRDGSEEWEYLDEEAFDRLVEVYKEADIIPFEAYDNSNAYVETTVKTF